MQNYNQINSLQAKDEGVSARLPICEPYAEPMWYLNDSDEGVFFLLFRDDSGQMRTHSYPLTRLEEILPNFQKRTDVWISQATFYNCSRTLENIKSIGLSFIDLDCYKFDWAKGMSPSAISRCFINLCRSKGIPLPSEIVFSGRGLQVKWLYTRLIPQPALTRWKAVQKELVSRFSQFGADAQAKDAARVLRLVSTVNSKSGARCELVYVNQEYTYGPVVRYDFDKFADAVLPYTRQQIQAFRKKAQEKKLAKKLSISTLHTLNLKRFEDLERLVEMRNGISEGHRMSFLFWQMNFQALAGLVTPDNFNVVAQSLANKIDPRWNWESHDLVTVLRKLTDHMAGKVVVFNDVQYPPLYTPTNETLISALEITESEQAQLQTIISSSEKLKRHRKAQEAARRKKDAMPRAEYRNRSEARAERARELRRQGMSMREIAHLMEMSVGSISRYLKNSRSQNGGVQSACA